MRGSDLIGLLPRNGRTDTNIQPLAGLAVERAILLQTFHLSEVVQPKIIKQSRASRRTPRRGTPQSS